MVKVEEREEFGEEQLVSDQEAAGMLGLTTKTLRAWRRAGKGPKFVQYTRPGGGRALVFYVRESVESMVLLRSQPRSTVESTNRCSSASGGCGKDHSLPSPKPIEHQFRNIENFEAYVAQTFREMETQRKANRAELIALRDAFLDECRDILSRSYLHAPIRIQYGVVLRRDGVEGISSAVVLGDNIHRRTDGQQVTRLDGTDVEVVACVTEIYESPNAYRLRIVQGWIQSPMIEGFSKTLTDKFDIPWDFKAFIETIAHGSVHETEKHKSYGYDLLSQQFISVSQAVDTEYIEKAWNDSCHTIEDYWPTW